VRKVRKIRARYFYAEVVEEEADELDVDVDDELVDAELVEDASVDDALVEDASVDDALVEDEEEADLGILLADLMAWSMEDCFAGEELLSQLLPFGTLVFFPTSLPLKPKSESLRDPSELTIWLNLEEIDWS